MSSKKKSAYIHAFRYIHRNIISLKCASYTTDYELAMRNALKELMTEIQAELEKCGNVEELFETTFTGCWFHFCQALKRNGSKIPSFFDIVRKNSELSKVYYKLLCLPLLPAPFIDTAFRRLRDDVLRIAADQFIDNKPLAEFLRYYEKQWLLKVKRFLSCFWFIWIRCNICCIAGK